ncbi:MAG TPA: gas vesicle protein GvpG [Longimicrobiales bacterium]|nr:gas vesicle protein GvpG [Longimicrobiales bacterium]
MGLLKHLLFWPYTGPRFLTEFALNQVEGVVREELTDDSAVKAELLELQLQLELGDIDDDEYVAREAVLMQRLREIRDWRERLGMGVSGGPVRVQRDPAEEGAAGDVRTDPGTGATAAGGEPGEDGPQVADPRGGVDIDLNLDWE